MADPEERFEELEAKFRQHGYRMTPQRVALLRLLSTSEGHPSANSLHEQIKEQFPTTSLATIYKTLVILKDMGEVLELGFSGDDNRYDGNKPYPHPHLICLHCRRIVDLRMRLVNSLEQEVTELSGYKMVGHRLDFYGICPDCQSGE
ncbi:MAG: Fur family transcriptional regulator [Anaerolineae bacterium]